MQGGATESEPEVIHGRTEVWNESGTEGNRWSVYDKEVGGYEGLHVLENGDHLTVYDDDDSILFEGVIRQIRAYGFGGTVRDEITGRDVYWPPAPLLGGWTQEGWNREDWGKLFYEKRRAKLIKRQK